MKVIKVMTIVCVLSAGLIAGAAAGPALELKGIGNYADPHRITVGTGDTVTLGLAVVSQVESLASFQTDLAVVGPASVQGVARGKWFSGNGAFDSQVASSQPAPGKVRLLGYCFANPAAVAGSGDLATVSLKYEGPGPVTVTAQLADAELADTSAGVLGAVQGNVSVVIEREPCESFDHSGNRGVGFEDLATFSRAYGSAAGQPYYVAAYDLNSDGKIDFKDLSRFSGCYGKRW